MAINWNRRKYTEQQFTEAWNNSLSIAGCARALGLTIFGTTYTTMRTTAKELNLTQDHMTGQGWNVGLKFVPKPAQQMSEILVPDSTYSSSSSLKRRIVAEGLLEERCSECKIGTEWNGKKLSLQLDHINGKNRDNRIENLRLLCPNCHSQTETFCRKKKVLGT